VSRRAATRRRAPRSAAAAPARVALLVAALAASLPAFAPAQPLALELRLDNDQFALTPADDERWYTHGFVARATYDAAPDALDARVLAARCAALPGCEAGARVLRTVSLEQTIHAPAYPATAANQPDDRPFAATLAVGLAVASAGERTRETLALRLGVVGPAALGEQVQNTLHELIGETAAAGWPWQVRAQPLLELDWSRLVRGDLPVAGLDWVGRAGVTLGTPITQAALGAMLRVGLPPAAPGWPGEPAPLGRGGGWHLYAGVEGRAVARNVLIDGERYGGAASQVTRETRGGDLFAGVSLAPATDWRVEFTVAWRAVEFSAPTATASLQPQRFGMLALRWMPPR
jgi:lipid A 3-O-deacylase